MDAGDHVKEAEDYARKVIAGKIPTGKFTRLACERHFRDLEAAKKKSFPFEFDPGLAEDPIDFIELLPHVKGKWAKPDPVTGETQRLTLEPWQKFILISIFGWIKKKDGNRRFQKARIYVPRKNGKSILAAGIGLYMLAADDEPGAEVYSGATSQKQAWEVFNPAKQMCLREPEIVAHYGLEVNAGSITHDDGNCKFEPVIGKPGDGSSPHAAVIDEFHEHDTDDLIDTMETGQGARDQPLSLVISTAGNNVSSPCREDWKICEKILENAGGFEDETTFAIIFALDDGDEWDTEEALRKANPNWGVSINVDRLLAELNAAKQTARKQSAFRTKYLNQWVTAKEGFFNVVQWNNLEREITREDFIDAPCYLSGDLASKCDIVALMQLFCLPPEMAEKHGAKYAIFGKYFLPEAALDRPENQHFRTWHRQKHIEIAGDEVTDLESFEDETLELCKEYQVEEMPSDPNRAWGVYPKLVKAGVPVVEYRNVMLMMSEPMKQVDALIRSGDIIHDGDPVLAWAISNVVAKLDRKDNVFPNKERPENKIDPVVGLIMAMGRAMLKTDDPEGPVFAW